MTRNNITIRKSDPEPSLRETGELYYIEQTEEERKRKRPPTVLMLCEVGHSIASLLCINHGTRWTSRNAEIIHDIGITQSDWITLIAGWKLIRILGEITITPSNLQGKSK